MLLERPHAKMTGSSRNAERCESGRIGVPGEHVCWQRHRGFESHPLRHSNKGNGIESGARTPAKDSRRGWGSNGGSEGGGPPSWGDRSEAEARGGITRRRMPTLSAILSRSVLYRVGPRPHSLAVEEGGVRTGGCEGGVPPSWGDRSGGARGRGPLAGAGAATRRRMPTLSAIPSGATREENAEIHACLLRREQAFFARRRNGANGKMERVGEGAWRFDRESGNAVTRFETCHIRSCRRRC